MIMMGNLLPGIPDEEDVKNVILIEDTGNVVNYIE